MRVVGDQAGTERPDHLRLALLLSDLTASDLEDVTRDGRLQPLAILCGGRRGGRGGACRRGGDDGAQRAREDGGSDEKGSALHYHGSYLESGVAYTTTLSA